MPSHCVVCGHSSFTTWRAYVHHMATTHNVVVHEPATVPHRPIKTSSRTTPQIVEALERKLGKHHFFNAVQPGLEDEYVAFMRRLKR